MNEDSKLFGVSIRAWLSIIFTLTVCAMALLGMETKEPLYTLASLAVGFYFGQKNQAATKTSTPSLNTVTLDRIAEKGKEEAKAESIKLNP